MNTITTRRTAVIPRTPIRPARSIPAALAIRASVGKLAIDFTLASALLVITLPVMFVAMLFVRLTSRGPAMYTQTRLGRSGRPFTIYKIRTMCADAESLTGPRWALPGDPRITPLGKVLRTLHIDELPQLVNVLRGEMSLVGPRPERPEIAAGLRKRIRGYDRRLSVKPGITGLAQIHLPPDETVDSVRRKLLFDRAYIQQCGLMVDLGILVCTGLKVLGLKRIYRR